MENNDNFLNNPKYKITILGSGSSAGVPTIETGFGNCDPKNIKNHRSRASILIEINDYIILVDTSPDLRIQSLNNNIQRIDSILFTHFHSDHIAGVYDVRSFNRLTNSAINCYLTEENFDKISTSCELAFRSVNEIKYIPNTTLYNFYRPTLIANIIKNQDIINFTKDVQVEAFSHIHGKIFSTGYKFNNKVAYITDVSEIPNEIIDHYKNLDVLIISACTLNDHFAHMKFSVIVELIQSVLKPKIAYLTHMNELIDYDTQTHWLKEQNINNIFLAYDGLIISS
ncbi:MBL fold metallo-hydrolase [Rickettsiales bacterium LUAb2]